jgi:uncharacterized protein (TIGR02145 family)
MKTTNKIVAMVAMSAVMMAVAMSCGDDNSKKSDEQKQAEEQKKSFPFGTASFASTTTWKVGAQEWSDAVKCTGCEKEEYFGGKNIGDPNYKADCRSIPNGYKGNFFSWQAVKDYDKVLCPDGWRVPSKQDFINLDKALGGNGSNRYNDATVAAKYRSDWGGELGRYCLVDGDLSWVSSGCYWSLEQYNENASYNLRFNNEDISPQSFYDRYQGMVVRCVKDVK